MTTCTYDNPATMHRECWKDKKLLYSYCFDVLPPFALKPVPARHFFFGANIGGWKCGQCVGDIEAVDFTNKENQYGSDY